MREYRKGRRGKVHRNVVWQDRLIRTTSIAHSSSIDPLQWDHQTTEVIVKVKVYAVDTDPYKETLRSTCDLNECFPDRDAAYYVALVELNRMGRCWCGGGAAPCTLLMKVED
jgi:hypothetical protein